MLRVHIAPSTLDDICDKCGRSTDEPVIVLKSGARSRNDHMLIFVHESCLLKAVTKAKTLHEALSATSKIS